MVLPVTIPPTSQYRLLYSGPVGVAGVGVQQAWDITQIPKYIREVDSFRDNWRVFVRQVDPGVSDVSKEIDFSPPVGTPTEIVLTLTAADFFNLIDIEFWYIHSVVR
jgi:hypothetical protein